MGTFNQLHRPNQNAMSMWLSAQSSQNPHEAALNRASTVPRASTPDGAGDVIDLELGESYHRIED